MLEGLADVPWHELRHAYGPADDVPSQIRSLLDEDPAARERALWELFGNIHHQSTLYDATAHAVPFLAEVALSAEVHPRVRIELLWLLAAIAGGGGYAGAPTARERPAVEAAHAAVHEAVPAFLPHLKSVDEQLALATALLVAYDDVRLRDAMPDLRALLERVETHEARRFLALLLQLAGERDDELLGLVREAASPDDPDDLDGVLAALARGDRHELQLEVLEDLYGAAATAERLPPHA